MPRILGASIYSENFHGSDITDEEWEFLRSMAAYQKRWQRRYPSWREVLFVVHCLGYRKTAPATPVDSLPATPAELEFAASYRRAREAASESPLPA